MVKPLPRPPERPLAVAFAILILLMDFLILVIILDSKPLKACYKLIMQTTFRLIGFVTVILFISVFGMCVLLVSDHKSFAHLPTYIYACGGLCGVLSSYLFTVTFIRRRKRRQARLAEELRMLELYEEERRKDFQAQNIISMHEKSSKRDRFRSAQIFGGDQSCRRPKEYLCNNSRNKNVYFID